MVEHALVEEHLRQHDLGEVRLLDGVAETSLMCGGEAKGEGVTAIVCGPVPCDAPDSVATLMPLVPLEFRQQSLVRAVESSGSQNVHPCHELFLT